MDVQTFADEWATFPIIDHLKKETDKTDPLLGTQRGFFISCFFVIIEISNNTSFALPIDLCTLVNSYKGCILSIPSWKFRV